MELESIPFGVRSVVENACDLLSINAFQKDLDIICRVRPEVPDMVVGDPNRLQQIIINLIGNAIKFTSEGEVVVEVRLADPSSTAEQVQLQFSVSDTGVGIPAEKQKLVFESFSQADSTTTRKFGGTGLGLSICSRFVKMMNGRIWVESEQGLGSTFHFIIDVGCDKQPVRSRKNPLKQKQVWINVANQTARTVYNELVTHLYPGANVHFVSILEALQRIRGNSGDQCDLLLIDVDQPFENLMVHDAIKNLDDWNGVSIVGVFRKDRTEFLADQDKLRAFRLLARPVSRKQLEHAINSVFGVTGSKTGTGRHLQVDASDNSKLRPLRILLAEDVDINAQIATHFIERMGHNVTVAEDGVKALLAFEANDFDAVFMDVEMPEMDGMETTREIRKRESTGKQTPIVAMTAHAIPEIQKQCFDAGMNDYITKPLEPERLREILNQLQRAFCS